MAKIRVQMTPEIEFKMDMDIPNIDSHTRSYDVQQHKVEVYAEFERRLKLAFPEEFKIHTFAFGLDTGWHEDLAEDV